ncbi:hypothetical protein V8C26DRAFT_402836 [Trichoderma gracile]
MHAVIFPWAAMPFLFQHLFFFFSSRLPCLSCLLACSRWIRVAGYRFLFPWLGAFLPHGGLCSLSGWWNGIRLGTRRG